MTKDAFSRADLEGGAALHVERRSVRFHDVDAAGIVFYPRVLEYFSDAYLAFLAARGYDVARSLGTSTVGLPLAHAEADYLRPLRFGDPIDVAIVALRLGETSFRVGYKVARPSGEIAALGQTVHVCIDRTTFRPAPLSAAVRGALSP